MSIQEANANIRSAVEARIAAARACDRDDDQHSAGRWHVPSPMAASIAGCRPAQQCAIELLSEPVPQDLPFPQSADDDDDDLDAAQSQLKVHPTSRRFYELCDAVRSMHARKSRDYGCPNGTDPLRNIRDGAKFVGIPAWRGAMVRLSDKVTRLATFNATGQLSYEGVEDTLLDLASYALLSLLLYQEDVNAQRDL